MIRPTVTVVLPIANNYVKERSIGIAFNADQKVIGSSVNAIIRTILGPYQEVYGSVNGVFITSLISFQCSITIDMVEENRNLKLKT